MICQAYRVACVGNKVTRHITSKHAGSPASARAKEIQTAVETIPGIIYDQKELKDWSVPPPTTAPIPYIPPPKEDGLGCNQYPYIARQIKRMQQHCRQKYGWVNTRRQGRYTSTSEAAIPVVP